MSKLRYFFLYPSFRYSLEVNCDSFSEGIRDITIGTLCGWVTRNVPTRHEVGQVLECATCSLVWRGLLGSRLLDRLSRYLLGGEVRFHLGPTLVIEGNHPLLGAQALVYKLSA